MRPITLEDADAVQRCASDAKLAATCNVPHPYPLNGGQQFAERSIRAREQKQRFPHAIVCNDQFVGVIGINLPDFSNLTAEVDYWLAVPFWGRGIMTQAVGLVVEIAFQELGFRHLFSSCWAENPASCRVLEKNGFRKIQSVLNDGHFGQKFLGQTIHRFRLSYEEWLNRAKAS
nr:GNAT family N-acetyltransferase [Gloeocapsopsis dulcis]